MASRIDNLPELNPFTRGLPKAPKLLGILLIGSILMGISATALINGAARLGAASLLADGAITGILVILLPALLTVVLYKSLRRYIRSKYILFVVMIGAFAYGIFVNIGGAVYSLTGEASLAAAIILVGNASIFAWWFFVDKLLLGQHRRASLLALAQPTLNVVLYIPYNRFLLDLGAPLGVLLIKLYAGIAVFLVVSYAITFVLERPLKSSIGMRSILDSMSLMIQNWLFGINVPSPFGAGFGTPADVPAHTIAFRRVKDGALKALFFIPEIHYGPAGTVGGSNFPYLLEQYAVQKYHTAAFIMHAAVNIDRNPVSTSQLAHLKQALDSSMSRRTRGSTRASYSESSFDDAKVIRLHVGDANLITFTRAPRVTEDVAPEAAQTFRAVLETRFGPSVLIDAHNSRYETAPKIELAGVGPHSKIAHDFSSAISMLSATGTSRLLAGFSGVELFNRLGKPLDIAEGNLNAAVFVLGRTKRAMLQFNANNVLPRMRDAILAHVKREFGIDAEIYTTDTHFVNSFGLSEDNELGKTTRFRDLVPVIDDAITQALSGICPVRACYDKRVMRRFKVWGPNTMEKMTAAVSSMIELARVVVPIVVAAGFVAAAWVILLV